MAFSGSDLSLSERFASFDDAKARFVSKVYTGLTACLALATVTCLLGAQWFASNPAQAGATIQILRFVPLAMLFVTWFVRLSGTFGWIFLISFVAIDGFVLGPMIEIVSRHPGGSQTVLLALALTTGIFVGLSAYVRYTGKDFSWMGGFLTIASFAIIIGALAVMLFGVTADIWLLLSVASAMIFSGWILYDTSAVTREYYRDNNVCYAILMLFLDFVGLFINLLSILNRRD